MKKIILILVLLIFVSGCGEQLQTSIEEKSPEIIPEEIETQPPTIPEEAEIVCTDYDSNEEECSSHQECKWTSSENICEPIDQVEGEDKEMEDDEGDDEEMVFVSELEKDLPNTPSNEICKKLPLTKGLSQEEILKLTPGNRYTCLAIVNNNAKFCELIEIDNEADILGKDDKNLCLAHAKKDVSYCKKLSNNDAKHDCYFGLSGISGDIDICDGIDYDQKDKQLCYWSFSNALYWEDKSDKITTEHCNKLPAGEDDRDSCLAQKEGDVSLCKNKVNCLTLFEQPMSFCTTGKGKVLEYCIRDRAMTSKEFSICETLTGEERDDCIGDFAGHITQDISTCDMITNDFARNTCYKDVAIQSGTNFWFNLYN